MIEVIARNEATRQSSAGVNRSGLLRSARNDEFGLSPHPPALVGRKVELFAFLAVERIVQGLEVADRQPAIIARRMAIGTEPRPERPRAPCGRPRMRIGD